MAILKVKSVNISEQKGTIKKPVEKITLNKQGVLGDAHAGSWHRQVSMLSESSIKKFEKEAGRKIAYGEFAENITVDGLDVYKFNPLDIVLSENIILEVTQIGKKCHGTNCSIYKEVGDCVMPKEGIFLRVLEGGVIKPGYTLHYIEKEFKVMVISLSDRASMGEYEDKSGKLLVEKTQSFFKSLNRKYDITYKLIPDDRKLLTRHLLKAKENHFDIVYTTGGTGISPRDFTVDIVNKHLDVEIPGIMENIRLKYAADYPASLLSRSVAGVMGDTLVYTLPGSVKAVNEYMTEIEKLLMHSMYMVKGLAIH